MSEPQPKPGDMMVVRPTRRISGVGSVYAIERVLEATDTGWIVLADEGKRFSAVRDEPIARKKIIWSGTRLAD